MQSASCCDCALCRPMWVVCRTHCPAIRRHLPGVLLAQYDRTATVHCHAVSHACLFLHHVPTNAFLLALCDHLIGCKGGRNCRVLAEFESNMLVTVTCSRLTADQLCRYYGDGQTNATDADLVTHYLFAGRPTYRRATFPLHRWKLNLLQQEDAAALRLWWSAEHLPIISVACGGHVATAPCFM